MGERYYVSEAGEVCDSADGDSGGVGQIMDECEIIAALNEGAEELRKARAALITIGEENARYVQTINSQASTITELRAALANATTHPTIAPAQFSRERDHTGEA